MIKAILFDLDGVLIDSTKELHFNALNSALSEYSPKYVISPSQQNSIYEGLSTKKKLELLNKTQNLPLEWNCRIEYRKQEITQKLLVELHPSKKVSLVIKKLKFRGFKVGLCTNSIQKTTSILLDKLGCNSIFDIILTNEHVKFPKPHPEIYNLAIDKLNLSPNEVVILEDSFNGIEAATKSGAFVITVKSPKDVNLTKIGRFIEALNRLEECITKNHQFKQLVIKENANQLKGNYQSLLLCPTCNKTRYVNNHNIIAQIKKGIFTGQCQTCRPSAFQNGSKHVLYNPNKRSTHGYVILNVSELSPEQKLLAMPMSWKSESRPAYVFEHRLIMALHLNRVLTNNEIVHHKNGKKDDNRIENLLLVTTKQHHPGHGDDFYQKWQEAEKKIKELTQKPNEK